MGLPSRTFSVECLEARQLLAVDVVTSNLDDGSAGTLRSVIAAAAPGDTIQLDPSIAQINLTQGQIEINKNLLIQGPSSNLITLQQTTGGARLFQIDANASVSMAGLKLTGGQAGGNLLGGAIRNAGNLSLNRMQISGNSAYVGGGLFNETGATAVVTASTFSNSSTEGGGIHNYGTLTVIDSTFSGNSAGRYGGAIYNVFGMVTIDHCTIAGNSASDGGGLYNDTSGYDYLLGQFGNTNAVINVANSIVAANGGSDVSGSFANTDHNLIGTLGSATGFTTSGPTASIVLGSGSASAAGLGPLQNNGGPTDTRALLLGSPAIQAGDVAPPSLFPSMPAADQRGAARTTNGMLDIGAYQSNHIYVAGAAGFSGTLAQGQTVNWLASGQFPEVDNLVFGTNAFTSIQAAVNAAQPGETIAVAAGSYAQTVLVDKIVTFQGANVGATTTIQGTNDSGTGLTIDLANAAPSINGPALTGVRLNDFEVTGFSTGISVNGGSVYLANDTISNNQGQTGIYNNGALTLSGSTVSGNSTGAGGQGGGILNDSAGVLTLLDSTVSGNTAGQGGGIYSRGAVTITRSTIEDNSAGANGAGILNAAGGSLTVTQSAVLANAAVGDGGGVFNASGATMNVDDTTLASNSADLGGGLFNAGTATVIWTTVSGNSATQGGGSYNALAGVANVANTILAGNSASSSDPDVAGNYAVTDADLIGVTGDATGFATTGPTYSIFLGSDSAGAIGLGPLTNNGGATETMALLAGSPAISAGDILPPAPFTTPNSDQRGLARIVSGVTDIGAYQSPVETTVMPPMGIHSAATTGLPAVTSGATAFGDVNNDGKLDLIITGKDVSGTPITQLWMNQGNDTFQQAPLPASVVGLANGSVAWGDYDNDGYIDLVITGFDSSGAPHTYLLRNQGASNPGVFDDVTQMAMPGVQGVGYSSVTWGMINSDGLRDLLLSGQTAAGTPVTQLWVSNAKGGFFDDTQAAFPAGIAQLDHGSASWADLDNNGYFGFVLTGNDAAGNPVTQVWRNNGDGSFHLDATAAANLPQLGHSSAAFTYYAFSDSQPTLLLSGQNASGQWQTRLFRENGWQDITDSAAPGLGQLQVADPKVAWGDFAFRRFDSFVISGQDAANSDAPFTQLWLNDPIAGTFSDASAAAFGTRISPDVSSAAFAVGDAEGRHGSSTRADLLLMGEGPNGPTVQLWTNNGSYSTFFAGLAHDLITNVQYSSNPNQIGVTGDSQLPEYFVSPSVFRYASVTFNFFVRGGAIAFVWNPEELNDGTPTVPDNNLVFRPQNDFSLETGGQYYDNFISRFTEWVHLPGGQPMSITFATVAGVSAGAQGDARSFSLPLLKTTASGVSGDALRGPTLQWLDVNGDGKLDLFVGNEGNALWQNNGDGTFTNIGAQAFPSGLPQPQGNVQLGPSAYAWGDYNNDGLPDLLISGADASGKPVTELWHNNGSGTAFTNVTAQVFPDNGEALAQIISGSAAWGDFNNDGRLDLLISGSGYDGAGPGQGPLFLTDQLTATTQLWEQNANGAFSDVTAGAFNPPTSGNSWAQGFNADLLPSSFFAPNGNLAQYEAATQPLHTLAAAIRGQIGASKAQYFLASDVMSAAGIPGLDYGAVSWVDYNNDGRLDLLVSGVGAVWDNNSYSAASGGDLNGQNFVPQNFTQLWRNNGDGTFSNVTDTALPGVSADNLQSTAWGDYDNDGRADLFVSAGVYQGNSQLWHNNGDGTFTQTSQFPGGNGTWGDLYGNGRLDLLDASTSSAVYKNNGNGTFTSDGIVFPPNMTGSDPFLLYTYDPPLLTSAAFGDYLGDGRLGLAIADQFHGVSVLGTPPTTVPKDVPPAAPANLAAQINGTSVTFSWSAPANSGSTPASALVYKLRVGTTPGGADVISPVYVNAESNVLRTLNYTLQGLTTGQTYYWSVEAIDNSYHKSPFAAGQSFTVSPRAVQIVSQPADQTIAGGSQVAFTASAVGAPNPAVQWYISTDGGNTFTAVTDNSQFSGATQTTPAVVISNGVPEGVVSATLTIRDIPFSLDGARFKAVFSNDGFTTSAPTVAAVLHVTAMAPTVTITSAGGLSDGNAHGVSGIRVTGPGSSMLVNSASDPSLTYTYYAGSFTTAAQLAGQTPLTGAPSAAGTYTAVAHWSVSQWNGADKQHYTNADSAPTVFAIRAGSLTVTTVADSDPFYLANTLREAIAYASTQSGSPTVAFAPATLGAIFVLNSPLVINHSMTIAGGNVPEGAQTIDAHGQGRVFDIQSGTVVLRRLVLTNGSAVNGGAVLNEGGTVTLDGDLLMGNSATSGGAVYNATGATITLVNATLVNNSAATGAALFNDGAATLTNVTVTGNTATQSAGGLDNHGGTMNLTNTILAGNSAAGSPSDISGNVTGTYNLVGTGGAGSLPGDTTSHNQLGVVNPLLGPLGYYGGDINTVPLLPGSPAINAGTSGTGIPSTDSRNLPSFSRVGAPDIGSFESEGFTLNYVAGDQQVVGLNGSLAPLQATIKANNTHDFVPEPIAGGVVSFTVNPDNNGAGAILGASSFVLNSSGNISMPATANGIAGSYAVTASAAGASPLVYDLTNAAIVPLTAGALTPPTATEGQAFGPVTIFQFTDGNPNAAVSDYTATVNTGDATLTSAANPSNVTIVADAGGGFDVQLAYAYADELNGATFSVTVNGVGGASTSASGTITVADAPPAVSADKASVSAVENSLASNTGTWSDFDDAVVLSTSYGTVTQNNNGTWSWTGAAPDEASSITVTITATNADNSVSTTSFIVSGTDAPPTVSADNASVSAVENNLASNTGAWSDFDDAVTLSASYGAVTQNNNGTWSWTGAAPDEASNITVTITATNADNSVSTTSFIVSGTDAPPAVSADNASVSAVENTTASNTGTWSDFDDAVVLTASYGTVTQNNNGTWSWAGAAPDEANPITVTIIATNSDNSVSTTSFTVSGTDAPPMVNADQASVSAVENSLASNTGTWSDLDDAVSLTASYGTVTQNNNGTWSWAGLAPDEASIFTVTITATNADNSVSTTSFTVSGTDALPTVSADHTSVSAVENGTATNSGTWSDFDDAVTLSASYGTVTQNNNGTWNWSGKAPDEASSITVTITATNSDNSVSTTSFAVNGTDAPPTISADKASVSAVENSTATNTGTWADFDDAVTLAASYGTVTKNNDGTWSWAGLAPDEASSITVTITATNADHSVSTIIFTVSGMDAPPTVSADKASISAVENSSASNTGTWSDFDDAVVLTASYGTVTKNNNGTWSWSGKAPDEANSITVTITATNSGNSVATTSFIMNGTDAPLAGSSVATAAGIAVVQPAVLANATFLDGNTAAAASDFTVTAANWGDGSTSTAGLSVSGSGGTYAVNGSHLYSHQGKYSFSITVTDVGGQTAVIHGTATVAPLPVELLLLDPRGKGSLDLSGNADVELTSGPASVVVDSKNSAAVTVSGNAKLSAYELDVVGSPGVSVRGKPSLPGSVLSGVSAMSDPLSGLPTPPRPDGRPLGEIHARGHLKITLSPGVYLGGISVSDDATIVLKPGVYYVRGGIHVSGHGALVGDGVLIYSGSADDDDGISVTGQGKLQLSAPTSGAYQGIAIFQDPRSHAPIQVDGQGSLEVTGIIYAASATMNIDGNGQASISNATPNGPAGAILADLKVDGNGRLSIDPGSVTAGPDVPSQTNAQPTNPNSPHALYVEAVYEDVLGREPDQAGLAYWTQLLDAGAPPAAVAAAIAHSDEYYADFVIAPAYLNLLGRDADAASLKGWLPSIHAGMPDQQLMATLASSDEFYNNAGGTNTAWIDAVYTLLLGRSAEPAAEVYWNSLLNAGVSRFVVAEGIANSNENETQLINDAYFQYLGREADPAGLAYWLSQFAAGRTAEDIIVGFAGSAEYYSEHSAKP